MSISICSQTHLRATTSLVFVIRGLSLLSTQDRFSREFNRIPVRSNRVLPGSHLILTASCLIFAPSYGVAGRFNRISSFSRLIPTTCGWMLPASCSLLAAYHGMIPPYRQILAPYHGIRAPYCRMRPRYYGTLEESCFINAGSCRMGTDDGFQRQAPGETPGKHTGRMPVLRSSFVIFPSPTPKVVYGLATTLLVSLGQRERAD